MRIPFSREFDLVFRNDRGLIWKMIGAAAVTSIVVVWSWPRTIEAKNWAPELTPTLVGILILGSSIVGAGLALVLSLKDTIEQMIERPNPILRFYFGMGLFSLFAWVPTVLFLGFLVTMIGVAIPGAGVAR